MSQQYDDRPRFALPIALACAVAFSGCEFVAGFLGASPEEALVQATLDAWAAPGGQFMSSRFTRDTVGTVTETGERAWEVTIPDADAQTWALEVTRVEIYSVYPGEEFTRWLEDTARGLGLRSFLSPETKTLVSRGTVTAVGDLEVSFGRTDRRGRTEVASVALLRAGSDGDRWTLEDPEDRGARLLRDALQLVYADMIARDERVHSCMGSVDARSVERAVQLSCVADALALEYGG